MTRGELAVVSLRLLARLPLRVSQGLGAIIGWLMYLLPSEAKRVTRRNIARCLPELSPAEHRSLVRRSLMESGRTATETAAIWLWPLDRVRPLVREVIGEELLEAGLARGRGVVVLSPHLGNWEVAGLYFSLRCGITSMYRPPKLREMDALMLEARERGGAHLVPTDASGVRALMKALRQGRLIGILPDQNPDRDSGVFAPFFGHPALTMVLLPKLASKTGATVLFTWAERLPRGAGFRLHIRPAPAGIADADVTVAAAALNRGVEQCVRAKPEQYQWGYKRFKQRPEGEADFYARGDGEG